MWGFHRLQFDFGKLIFSELVCFLSQHSPQICWAWSENGQWGEAVIHPLKTRAWRWHLVEQLYLSKGWGREPWRWGASISLSLWVEVGLMIKSTVVITLVICFGGTLPDPDTAKTGTCRSSEEVIWAPGNRQGSGDGSSSAPGLY